MELKDLEEAVENMILQHDYPGCEVRALKLSLPAIFNNAPVKTYLQGLKSNSIYVQLAALRWFQTRAGLAKNHATQIATLLNSTDAWVKTETIRTIELTKITETDIVFKILELLKDSQSIVRVEATRTLGSLLKEIKHHNSDLKKTNIENRQSINSKIIAALTEATQDKDLNVRRKAIKALRKLGAFSTS